MKYIHIFITILLIFPTMSHAAIENLDEMEARKARRATNTYYTGESAVNSYTRQSESFAYLDTLYGNEVWVLSSTANKKNQYYTDISPATPWSADGARLGYFSSAPVTAFERVFDTSSSFVVRSDGGALRSTYDASNTTHGTLGENYFYWNPAVQDVYYTTGSRVNGVKIDASAIYKNSVSDTSISYSKILDLPGTDTDRYNLKKVISPDGTTILPRKSGSYFPAVVYPDAQARLLDPDGWPEWRGQTTEWAGGDPFACQHDMYLPSSDFVVVLFSMDCNEVVPVFYKYNLTGSAADGGPLFDKTETAYSTWNSKEVEPMWTDGPPHVPWRFGASGHWWGHPGFDRWGRTVTFNDSNAYSAAPDGTNSLQTGGIVTWDYVNRKLEAQPDVPMGTAPQSLTPLTQHTASYVDHNAWSDYVAFGYCYAGRPPETFEIRTAEYNKTAFNGNDYRAVSRHYGNTNGATSYSTSLVCRVAQSPDGTKISHTLNFLTDSPDSSDIAYTVAYTPHPPEVTSVTNNSGTYTVRFDWRTDQEVSRGYTQRGWPDEATDDPPPPRETKLFRLWRSPNGTNEWTPVGTVNANIFSRYNFSTGDWTGTKYWEITDTPGAGTWHYAVTAQEHSGLESRTLSNVFSTTGMQTAAYPSDPKGDSDFATVYNPTTVRYYNIYAADGTAPTATRQDRIASIPAAAAGEYVDWLGDTAGTTQYLVTAVDTQGNESGAIAGATRTILATPGQYKVAWDVEEKPGDPVTPSGQARRLSLAGRPIKLAEPEQ